MSAHTRWTLSSLPIYSSSWRAPLFPQADWTLPCEAPSVYGHTSVITQDCNLGNDLCFPMIHSEHKAGTPVLSVFASPANVIGPGMFDLWNNHIRRRLRRGAGMCWKQTPCSAPWPRRSWCRWAADTVSDGPALKRVGEIWGEDTLSSIETWGEVTERSDWGLL